MGSILNKSFITRGTTSQRLGSISFSFFFLHVAISDSIQWLPYLGFVPSPTRTTSKGLMSLLFNISCKGSGCPNFLTRGYCLMPQWLGSCCESRICKERKTRVPEEKPLESDWGWQISVHVLSLGIDSGS